MVSEQRKWVVPAFWDDDFLKEIENRGLSRHIYEFFGSLSSSPMGTMLTRASLPDADPNSIKRFVDRVHSMGIRFSYTLNALAMGNMEYTTEGQKQINQFLYLLRGVGVDSVIVSNPVVAVLVKNSFPSFELSVSSAACVDSIQKAMYWQNLGASSIKLPLVVNRNFHLLQNLSQGIKMDMEVMVNQLCLYHCPMERYHTITTNTDSQLVSGKESKSFIDWCRLKCNQIRWSEPAELIKSPIVRPEDIPLYEKYGVKYFKIIGRNKNMRHVIISILEAYVAGKWDGNLLSIVGVNANPPPYELIRFYPEDEFKRYFAEPLYNIDNSKLDGFINHFIENGHKCGYVCGVCRYCDEVAGRVMELPSKERLTKFLNALKKLESTFG